MAWLRRSAILLTAVVAMAGLTALSLDPTQARANVACEVGISPGAAVTGALGIGNPVGDACEAITDPVLGAAEDAALAPLKDAVSSIGKGVFNEITSWATDGAVWLLGEVVELTNETTSPDLLSKGFLRQYRQMASIAVVLALAMVIFAVLESLGRGDAGMLGRVFLVNVPVAALATSAAYVVVQLLVASTDGFSELIAHSTAHDTREFFKGAVQALGEAGGDAGATAGEVSGEGAAAGRATGTVAAPLFVTFIAAILAAVAAFLVWIELLMRAAAIYAVALFMPLALAASIWPRWLGALRRTGELIVVVVFSKFVIVAIIALAASLLANTEGEVEHVLSAGALLLLACFSPAVLFRLVPFAEGAVSSAFSRQSVGGAGARAIQTASSMQMMRRSARANWAGGSSVGGGVVGGGGKSAGGGSRASKGGGSGASGAARGGAAGASGAAGAAALPVAAAFGVANAGKATAGRLSSAGVGQSIAETGGSGASSGGSDISSKRSAGASAGGGEDRPPRPASAAASSDEKVGASPSTGATPKPAEARGGQAPSSERKAPRPSGEDGAPKQGGTAGKAKP